MNATRLKQDPQRLYVRKMDTQWIVGFTDGEGCFHVGINSKGIDKVDKQLKLGVQVLPEFTISQHKADVKVLYALKSHFDCGVVRKNHGNTFCFRVRGHENLKFRVVPFFEKHKLKTRKGVDFLKFRKVIQIMDRQEHLTQEGLEQIRKIKSSMNNPL